MHTHTRTHTDPCTPLQQTDGVIRQRLERAPHLVFLLQLRVFIVGLKHFPLPNVELRVEEEAAEGGVCVPSSPAFQDPLTAGTSSSSDSLFPLCASLLAFERQGGRLFIGGREWQHLTRR